MLGGVLVQEDSGETSLRARLSRLVTLPLPTKTDLFEILEQVFDQSLAPYAPNDPNSLRAIQKP